MDRCFLSDFIPLNTATGCSPEFTFPDAPLVSESTRCLSHRPLIMAVIDDWDMLFLIDRWVGISPRAAKALLSVWADEKEDFAV